MRLIRCGGEVDVDVEHGRFLGANVPYHTYITKLFCTPGTDSSSTFFLAKFCRQTAVLDPENVVLLL